MCSDSQSSAYLSRRTNAIYPVSQTLEIELLEGARAFTLTPLFQDQELIVRASGLPVYREGAVSTPSGSGYLELTDYVDALKM